MFATSGMVLASFVGVYAGQGLVTETSKSIFNRVCDIITDNHPDIKEITEPMDLVAKVQVVGSIIREIMDYIEINSLVPSNSLKISLKQIKEILDEIHKDINDIKNGIEYHKSLWFHRIRTPSYYKIIKKLKSDKYAMDSRLDNLVKVINLFSHSQETNINKIKQSESTSIPEHKDDLVQNYRESTSIPEHKDDLIQDD